MRPFILLMTGLTLICMAAACSDSTSSDTDESEMMIEEVRSETQPYHSFDQAVEDGWAIDLSGCVEHPEEGGMGHHYGRLEYIDGRIDHLQPQILLYEPLENGDMEFVGVEYIIPFDILSADATPPELFGEQYLANHQLQLWALHVWTEKTNPNGMFYDWNPNVSCQYAQSQSDEDHD